MSWQRHIRILVVEDEPDQRDIVEQIISDAGYQVATAESAEAALDAVLSALSAQRRLARLLITQGYSMGNAFESKRSEIFDRFANVISQNLDEAKSDGQISDINTDLAARVWLGAVNETVVHWLFSDGQTPKEAASDLRRLLLASVQVGSPSIKSKDAV